MLTISRKEESLWDVPFRLGLYDFWLPETFRHSLRASFRELGLSSSARMLDVGCGSGPALPHVAEWVKRGGRFVGVDISGGGLSVARMRAEQLGIAGRIELIRGDMRDLSRVVHGKFEAAMSHFAIFALTERRDRIAALSEVVHVLEPGGRFVVTVPGENYTGRLLAGFGRKAEARRTDTSLPSRWWRQWVAMTMLELGTRRVVEPRFDSGTFHRYAPGELKRDLERAGFREVHVESIPDLGAHRAIARA